MNYPGGTTEVVITIQIRELLPVSGLLPPRYCTEIWLVIVFSDKILLIA